MAFKLKHKSTLITILLTAADLGSSGITALWSTPNTLMGLSAPHTLGLQLSAFKKSEQRFKVQKF